MFSSSILFKNKEELTSMVGEIGKPRDSIFLMAVSLLNMTIFHFISMVVGLCNLLVFWLSCNFKSLRFGFGSMLPTPFSVVNVFKRSHLVDLRYNNIKPSFHVCLSSSSSMLASFWSFCLNHHTHFASMGIHQGPPTTGHFLSTSTHHLGSWLRNTPLVPWSLHTSMEIFFVLGDMFTSMAFDSNCWVPIILVITPLFY